MTIITCFLLFNVEMIRTIHNRPKPFKMCSLFQLIVVLGQHYIYRIFSHMSFQYSYVIYFSNYFPKLLI